MEVNIRSLKDYLIKNGKDLSYKDLANQFGIVDINGQTCPEKVRRIWRKLKVARIPSTLPKVTKDENGNSVIDYSAASITSIEDLIDVAGINIDYWDVKSFRVSSWQDFKDDTKYAVRAVFDQSAEVRQKIREEFIEEALKHSPEYKPVKYPKQSKDTEPVVYELCLPDLHIGKLAMKQEVGEPYSTDVAVMLFEKAIEKLLIYSQLFAIDRILVPIGNDMLNTDGLAMTTTKGTPQQDDVVWQQSFIKCREMLVKVIDRLRLVAPVDVLVIPGNHDYERTFYLGDALQCWYNNCKEVTVDNSMSPRKYYRYGTNLLGFTHGNQEKHADLPLIMARERSEDWAEAKFTEWHVGHFHKRKSMSWVDIDENFGTVVRVLPSLCGTDSWHHSKGYVGNIRAGQGYFWGKESGYKGHFQVNLNEIIKEK
jgi:hypothetical protein